MHSYATHMRITTTNGEERYRTNISCQFDATIYRPSAYVPRGNIERHGNRQSEEHGIKQNRSLSIVEEFIRTEIGPEEKRETTLFVVQLRGLSNVSFES